MKTISFLENIFPVRAFSTEKEDASDDWRDVALRNAALQDLLNVPIDRVFYARETHSGSVYAVTKERPDGWIARSEEHLHLGPEGGYDALVTSVPGVLLCIWTADCLPLFLFDPAHHIAAIAHCGWRGISENIVANTIDVMKRLGTEPEQIVTAFGPCICENCYEVSEDLRSRYAEKFSPGEMEALFVPKQNGKFLLNLIKAVEQELLRCGVRQECMEDTGICSYESAHYASYRRDGHSDPFRQTLSGIMLC